MKSNSILAMKCKWLTLRPPRIAPACGPPLWEAVAAKQAGNDPAWDLAAQPTGRRIRSTYHLVRRNFCGALGTLGWSLQRTGNLWARTPPSPAVARRRTATCAISWVLNGKTAIDHDQAIKDTRAGPSNCLSLRPRALSVLDSSNHPSSQGQSCSPHPEC
jgi:hypothetical protein